MRLIYGGPSVLAERKEEPGYAGCHSVPSGFSPSIEMNAGRLLGI